MQQSQVGQSPKAGRAPRQSLCVVQLPDALLLRATVREVTGYSDRTLRRKVAAQQFPAPLKLSAKSSRWRSADVQAWIRSAGAR